MSDVNDKEVRVPNIPVGPYNVTLKVVSSNNGQALTGGEFELYRMPRDDSRELLVCDGQGEASFVLNDEWEEPALKQTKAPEGYQLNTTSIDLDPTKAGLELLDPESVPFVELEPNPLILDGYTLTVKNSPESKPEKPSIGSYNFILLNCSLYNGEALTGAEFKLTDPHNNQQELIWDKIALSGKVYINLKLEGEWKLEQTKAPEGYQLNTTPIIIRFIPGHVTIDGDEASDWFDYDSASKTLTIKNTPIQSPSEGGTKMKVATDNSLKELIKLVKSQPSTSSGGILNVTLDYTIPSYSPVEVETKRKRVYADIPCVNSKVAMNAQITPNDNIENMSLLTYAEPFDGYIRCYFSEQPTEAYIIDSVELTPVTSIVKKK